MKRLYTAFVSSTFRDLKEERQRLVKVMLGQQCVPFGMEFFPSTGRSQWPIIEESIRAADFCVFVVAGRYGTISDDAGISWTHREFREAVAQEKPLVGILHEDPAQLPSERCEPSAKGRASLARFRAEIEERTICRYYRTDADLVEALALCVGALREEGRIQGWVPAGPQRPLLEESDYDRVYELTEMEWRFSHSETPGTWDGFYRGRRRLVANDAHGLATCTLNFSRETDSQLPFDDQRAPDLQLVEATRSGSGFVVLRPPRRRFGGTFEQDVAFNPPLSPGETADFTIEGHFPAYKFATREDLVSATLDSKAGPRSHDWTSRSVVYPTRHLRLSVFLPLSLKATPRGPMLGRDAARTDPALSDAIARNGCYSCEQVDVDGEPGYLLRLDVRSPTLRVRHRVAWDLPSATTLNGGAQTS